VNLHLNRVSLDGRLRDVSLHLRPGELTAICGPNGAGKSTLIQIAAGLLAPDDGSAMLNARSLAAIPARERAKAIGYLPQSGEVAWDVSVATLVALGRLPHGAGRKDAVAAAMAELELEDLAARPISTLSGGERARTLLARVFAGEPDWILADEPFAALDLSHQQAIAHHLRGKARGGAGVVVVMHDLALAMNHADRVVVLDRGTLAADAQPREALDSAVIERVWGVKARWLGEAGSRALAMDPLA
jgi:iron complex transport system ATP-binding protein